VRGIIIKTQAEFDALPESFEEKTLITIHATGPLEVIRCPKRADIDLAGATIVTKLTVAIREMRGSSQVREMWESSQVGAMWESSQVGAMWESSQVGVMWESSQVGAMWESSQVGVMWGSSQVGVMWGSSQVGEMRESSQVREMRESSQVGEMRGSSQVGAMWESSQVREMWGSSQVGGAFGNVILRCMESTVSIGRLCQFSIAVCMKDGVNVAEKDDTATVLVTPPVVYTKDVFLDIYHENKSEDGIHLYKVVQDDYSDHYTGKIKYRIGKTVKPKIWDPDETRQCGDGLHLSPTPELALSYHQGRILRCLVKIDDFVVYPHDITKVRCEIVKVVEEVSL